MARLKILSLLTHTDLPNQRQLYRGFYEKVRSGIVWNILVSAWRVRQCSIGSSFSRGWNWFTRGFTRIWFNSLNDGICYWPYLRLPLEPGSFHRALGWRSFSCKTIITL